MYSKNKQQKNKQNQTDIHGELIGGYQRRRRWGVGDMLKGEDYTVMDDNWIYCGSHSGVYTNTELLC